MKLLIKAVFARCDVPEIGSSTQEELESGTREVSYVSLLMEEHLSLSFKFFW